MRLAITILSLMVTLNLFAFTQSGTNYTTDGSWTDVKLACYAATTNNARVIVPAGSFTWGADAVALFITNRLTLWGEGTNQTVISVTINNAYTFDSGMIRLFTNCTVGNFTVNFPVYNNSTLFSTHAEGWHITQLLYDGSNSAGQRFISGLPSGNVGLVDFCAIVANGTGTAELIFLQGPANAWTTADTLGTTNAVYVENCVFWSDGYVCDANANARIVVRFCDIHGVMKIDGHGKWSNSPQVSCRIVEAYNNHWYSIAEGGFWDSIELRGGTGMLFNNTVDDNTFIGRGVIELKEYGSISLGGAWGEVFQTPTYYPVDYQVGLGQYPKVSGSAPVYIWSNTKGGSQQVLSWADIPVAAIQQYTNETGNVASTFTMRDIIKADRDYYALADEFDGSTGMGIGAKATMLAITSTKTNVGFWVTDEGDWNNSAQPGHSGKLYSWNGSNWALKYVPLVYPYGSTSNYWTPPPQLPPVAVNDSYSTLAGFPATFKPTKNDLLRTTNGVLEIVSTSPTNGTVSMSGTNLTFTPVSGFSGTAYVGYELTDGVISTNSFALITISVTNAPVPPRGQAGLTAWYRFEDNLDDSGTNDNPATQLDGWLEAYTTGTNGRAVSMNGVASSAVGSPTFDWSENWSVAFWIKPDRTNTILGLASFCGNYNSYRINTEIDLLNGQISVLAPTGSGNWYDNDLTSGWSRLTSTNFCAPGVWKHVALTFNSGIFILYENGNVVGSMNSPVPANIYSSAIWLIGGKSASFQAVNYEGALDEVQIYQTYTLNRQEILAIAGFAEKFTLTVVSGTGSGSYTEGSLVSIQADSLSGQTFKNWSGYSVANSNSASTTLTMPTNAVTVTANYTTNPVVYYLFKK